VSVDSLLPSEWEVSTFKPVVPQLLFFLFLCVLFVRHPDTLSYVPIIPPGGGLESMCCSHFLDFARLLISDPQFRALLKNAFFAYLPHFLFTGHSSDVEHLSTSLLYPQLPPFVIPRRLFHVPWARCSTPPNHAH